LKLSATEVEEDKVESRDPLYKLTMLLMEGNTIPSSAFRTGIVTTSLFILLLQDMP
jgi:hypothetical protein